MKYIYTVLFSVISTIIFAQGTFEKLYNYGSSNPHSIIYTPDSGFVVLGSNQNGSNSMYRLWRFDKNGNHLLSRYYGGTDTDVSNDHIKTSDNGFIMTGYSESFLNGNYEDIYVVKLDSSGNVLWSSVNGDINANDRGNRIIESNTGDFYTVGKTHGFNGYTTLLVKLDANGNHLWTKGYKNIDIANAITEINNNRFLICGEVYNPLYYSRDLKIMVVDDMGNVIWAKTYEGQKNERVVSVVKNSSNEILLTGYTSSYGAGEDDIFLMKIDTLGNFIYFNTYGTNQVERPTSIIRNSQNEIYITGHSQIASTSPYYEPIIIRTNDSGDQSMGVSFGDSTTYIHSITVTDENSLALTGYQNVNFSSRMIISKSNMSFKSTCVETKNILLEQRSYNIIPITASVIDTSIFDTIISSVTTIGGSGQTYISCSDTCSVNSFFSSIKNRVCFGDSLYFLNSSTNSNNYTWLINGIYIDSVTNLSYIFNQPGKYLVELVASNGFCTDTSFTEVVVDSLVIPNFSFSNEMLVVQLQNQSSGAIGYEWDFDDNNQSFLFNPEHIYDSLGSYNICLNAFNSCDTNSVCKIINIADTLEAKFQKVYYNSTIGQQWTYDVVQTKDGGYAATGEDHSSGERILLTKFDIKGVTQWSKVLGVGSGQAMEQCHDLGYIVGGFYKGSSTTRKLVIIKTDKDGESIWRKSIPAIQLTDVINDIMQTPDFGYIATGMRNGQMFVMKLDVFGNKEWIKIYVSLKAGRSIIRDKDGSYLIVGENQVANNAMCILKIDSLGQHIWSKTYGYGTLIEIPFSYPLWDLD